MLHNCITLSPYLFSLSRAGHRFGHALTRNPLRGTIPRRIFNPKVAENTMIPTGIVGTYIGRTPQQRMHHDQAAYLCLPSQPRRGDHRQSQEATVRASQTPGRPSPYRHAGVHDRRRRPV